MTRAVVLIGPMGSGKSVVGRALAARLERLEVHAPAVPREAVKRRAVSDFRDHDRAVVDVVDRRRSHEHQIAFGDTEHGQVAGMRPDHERAVLAAELPIQRDIGLGTVPRPG